ncbi:hypothetical protein ACFGVR_14950 [Mucilaginibacter sp. AW1-3]
MKYLVRLFLNFRKPRFLALRYTVIVIDGRAFFLLSWRVADTHKLTIKALGYQTRKRAGSAYIAVPDTIGQLEIVIRNCWGSDRRQVRLIREAVTGQMDFLPVKQFDDFTLRNNQLSLNIPQARLSLFRFSVQNLNQT